jgi:phosphatidylglycerophosphatase A
MVTTRNPAWSGLWRNPVHLAAFGFGAGLSPKAPGTAGTVVAIPLYLFLQHLSVPIYAVLLLIMTGAGIWLCGRTARDLGINDHPGIVWDEIVGFMLTMAAVPCTWLNIALGFALFRVLDIFKPWPIGWCDRNVKGGWGIMLDDLAAGLFAGILLHFAQPLISQT